MELNTKGYYMPKKERSNRPEEEAAGELRANLGWITVFVLSSIPLVIWVLMKPLSVRFLGFAASLTSFGQVTGLLGMSLFSIALVLSARLKFLDDYFGGLNRAYLAHHVVGGTAFILLLFHPLVLSLRFVPVSLKAAALFLLPGADSTNTFGIIALFLVMLCLVITFFLEFPYPKWKLSHKFLGAAFFFAGFHSFFVASDISQSQALKVYMLALAAVGMFAFVYRSLLSGFFVKYFEYTVASIKPLSETLVELELKPKGERMEFLPGQFVFLSFVGDNISAESHPFSMSSAATEGNLRFIIKSLGDYTSQLKDMKIGTLAKVEGPFGQFSNKGRNRNQIWIAGGIGITPFLSMSRSFQGSEYGVDLYYCVRTDSEAIFFKELQTISERSKNFRVIPFCSEKEGYLDAKAILKMSGGIHDRDIFICGPPKLMRSLREQLLKLKVPEKNIHSEEFQI